MADLGQQSELDYTKQLVILRDMTKRFGCIHEAQKLQLNLWPYVVDPTIKGVEVALQFDECCAYFAFKGSTANHKTKAYQKRLQEFIRSIKFLLGDEWSTNVSLDGVTILGNDSKPAQKRKKNDRRRSSRKSKSKSRITKNRKRN